MSYKWDKKRRKAVSEKVVEVMEQRPHDLGDDNWSEDSKNRFLQFKKDCLFQTKRFFVFFFLIFMQNEGDYLSKVYFQIQLTASSRTKLASVQFFFTLHFFYYTVRVKITFLQ